MGTKIFFQDGSAIEISTEILEPGEMASTAYRKLLEFIEEEIKDMEDITDEGELIGDDLEDLEDDDLEDLEDLEDDDEDLAFDDLDEDEWEDDDDEDEWVV